VFLSRQVDSGTDGRPVRYTLCTTLRCNLDCSYCYIKKNPATMSENTARRAIAFIFHHAPPEKQVEIGFFGGEPLLEFPILEEMTHLIEHDPRFDPARMSLSLTTNGTIFSDHIASFLRDHRFKVCISCDGPPAVQNLHRRTTLGEGTASIVECTIQEAIRALPRVLVNAVYCPLTLPSLPRTVEYFSGLGLRQIFLNPDYSADWTRINEAEIARTYRLVADRYIGWYKRGMPHYISLIDEKIAVALRGGYMAQERCQMGTGELAITPDGGIYPCERLIGSGQGGMYKIGSLDDGIDLSQLARGCMKGGGQNMECGGCSLSNYCMNWCGCSNVFMTGSYNRVGPFLCASEKAAIRVALYTFTTIENLLGSVFLHHYDGQPVFNSMKGEELTQ
jgi:uncharacterized protein